MQKRFPAILTLLGAVLAVSSLAMAADLVDPEAEGVSAPYLIAGSRVTPSYPPAAYAAKYAGEVSLRATVHADGSVGEVEVLNSSRKSMGFEDAAIDAVSQWRFEPARKDDAAVDSYTWVRLRFNPPSSNSRGSVGTGFGQAPAQSMGMSAAMSSKSGGLLGAPSGGSMGTSLGGDAARTAFLPVDYKRYRKYGRASGRIGSIYDRRLLIPPGTGSSGLAPK